MLTYWWSRQPQHVAVMAKWTAYLAMNNVSGNDI